MLPFRYYYFIYNFFHSQTLSVAVSVKQGCQRKLGGPFQGTGFQTSKAGGKGFKNKRQELAVWGWGWEGFLFSQGGRVMGIRVGDWCL